MRIGKYKINIIGIVIFISWMLAGVWMYYVYKTPTAFWFGIICGSIMFIPLLYVIQKTIGIIEKTCK